MNSSLLIGLKSLNLPTVRTHLEEVVALAQRENWGYLEFFSHCVDLELSGRLERRLERYRTESNLLQEKTFATFQLKMYPLAVRSIVSELTSGDFVRHRENLLIFGLPGTGKTHLVNAIGHELVQKEIRVYYTQTYRLVGQLLLAKKNYELNKLLHKLDRFQVVICDDIGYVKYSEEEMEVLFNFFSERYENQSVVITSNLLFSEWDTIFKNPMTTMAAIDRLIHHAHILELTCESYRAKEAFKKRGLVDELFKKKGTEPGKEEPTLDMHKTEGGDT